LVEPLEPLVEPLELLVEPLEPLVEPLEPLVESLVVKVEEKPVKQLENLECLEHSSLSSSSSLSLSESIHKNDNSGNSNSGNSNSGNSNSGNSNSGDLIEVTLDLEKDDQKNLELVLKNPDDVYYKMYKDAKEKAKAAKNIAIEAYLAAEEIKLTYNLNNVDSSDSDDDSDDSSNDNDNDNDN
jgi:hypothetical protein